MDMTHATSVQRRVLVVDDDDAMRLLIVAALHQAGHRTVEAGDGLEALRIVEQGGVDAVITDISMPALDGLGLLRRLRADPSSLSLPVILLTSMGSPDDVVQGLRAGADDYVSKPVQLAELLARLESRLARPPAPALDLTPARNVGVVTSTRFNAQLTGELLRLARSNRTGAVGLIEVAEGPVIVSRLGRAGETDVLRQMATLLSSVLDPLDLVGLVTSATTGHQALSVLMPECPPAQARRRFAQAMALMAERELDVEGEALRITPVTGWVEAVRLPRDEAEAGEAVLAKCGTALSVARSRLDLVPVQWAEGMQSAEAVATKSRVLLTFGQVLGTFVLGVVVPFLVYFALFKMGIDVTWPVYCVVLASLLVTATVVWRECFFALDPRRPPDEPFSPYPKATAIIAAYLPNESATVVETVRQFLSMEYEGELQVILAYNTPTPLPVEQVLHGISRANPRFVAYRVDHSTSKAQNVNAALALATGEFVGMFDADHHPAPGSFERAWRWLSSGVDVVQGHCVVRNATASLVARMVAVEFEAIYAVAHPGRARAHGFGLFGGSNGYWTTDALRETRMQPTMLTEDIDSGIRALYDGHEVANDPALLSYELAPTSLPALWRQRLRWSQGWFQVSRRHLGAGLRNPLLSRRQKYGLAMLLGWREIYPWLSLQMFPVIALMAYKAGGITHMNWLVSVFIATTLFTASAGPVQAFFAYRLAAPLLRGERRWFVWYVVFSVLAYTEGKNVVARLAQLKELTGERSWIVTPRTAGNVAPFEEPA
jgi:DNA-binding response OmpR family regulator/cellulose synthase/poly-beta-1,6-N-acetylglucosamine synthase-like glycosyltransferase